MCELPCGCVHAAIISLFIPAQASLWFMLLFSNTVDGTVDQRSSSAGEQITDIL